MLKMNRGMGLAVLCAFGAATGRAADVKVVEAAVPVESTSRSTVFSMTLLPLGVAVQHAWSPRWSLAAGVSGTGSLSSTANSGDSKSLALGPTLGARFFPWGQAPSGLWLGPQLGGRLSWSESSFSGSFFSRSTTGSLALSGMAGYTWVTSSGLTLDFGAGLSGTWSQVLSAGGSSQPVGTQSVSLAPTVLVAVGWAL
jgi:hypothetical protein